MISEFLRKFPYGIEPTAVDGIDYNSARATDSFFFPDHDFQRHFKEENCYLIGDELFTNGEDWHEPIGSLSYRVNSDGFHGTDFVTSPAILCAGCSVTVGFAMNYMETWPHLLAEELDASVNVVGAPGASIAKIVYMVFAHMDRFGLPGSIHVCLPDVHRGWVQVRRGSGVLEESAILYDPETATFYTHDSGRGGMRVESPDGTKRQPPLSSVFRENMMALDILSMFSWTTGIPLVLSTYVESTHKVLVGGGRRYPGYVSLAKNMLDYSSRPVGHPTDCCSATSEDFCFPEERWTHAADGVHPGFHSHVHLAEAHLGERII